MAISTILGYPRIGCRRELKTAVESYWKDEIPESELLKTAGGLREAHWAQIGAALQKEAGIGAIPGNDFSLYDQMLDMCCHLSVVPSRYKWSRERVDLPTYFAMARGAQRQGIDVPAMEMSKWFDTNYHYIVPEFALGQTFKLSTTKPTDEFNAAKEAALRRARS
jgi:5-methyltetrahydropteroyltriglutamate--homocysteine methyltransferase